MKNIKFLSIFALIIGLMLSSFMLVGCNEEDSSVTQYALEWNNSEVEGIKSVEIVSTYNAVGTDIYFKHTVNKADAASFKIDQNTHITIKVALEEGYKYEASDLASVIKANDEFLENTLAGSTEYSFAYRIKADTTLTFIAPTAV